MRRRMTAVFAVLALMYEDGNSVVRRMPIDLEEMIDLATASATRTLTDDECRRHLHTDGCE